MNIILLGYGKMGKEIETLAVQRKDEILLKVNSINSSKVSYKDLSGADVAIEFSTPAAVYDNIIMCFNANIPIVVGTTGWSEKLNEIKNICKSQTQSLIYGANFSIGVNIIFHINKILAKIMKQYPQYEVNIEEVHHTQKADAPSGTAISLADGIIQSIERKKRWVNNASSNKTDLVITSVRKNNIPGIHTVQYKSNTDYIEIEHHALNRTGFAMGALQSADWIIGKKGCFSISDMFDMNYK